MADLYSDAVAVNAGKVLPSTTFNGRALKFFVFDSMYNIYDDEVGDGQPHYQDSDSLYSYVVQAIQKVAEIYYLGAPYSNDYENAFVFAIADTTADSTDYFDVNRPDELGPSTLTDAIANALNADLGSYWILTPLDDQGVGLFPYWYF
jgi:hypothetical protein